MATKIEKATIAREILNGVISVWHEKNEAPLSFCIIPYQGLF